jgi:CheY-like chemotaxis protein
MIGTKFYKGKAESQTMAKSGPIIIVEDDLDDQNILEEAIRETGTTNEIIFFANGPEALDFLKKTKSQPFVILSDINLPIQTGIEFKKKIDSDPQLRQKSIPFIFFSTSVDKGSVTTAYTEMTVQGFFKKSDSYDELKHLVKLIMEYWKYCKHPNT